MWRRGPSQIQLEFKFDEILLIKMVEGNFDLNLFGVIFGAIRWGDTIGNLTLISAALIRSIPVCIEGLHMIDHDAGPQQDDNAEKGNPFQYLVSHSNISRASKAVWTKYGIKERKKRNQA